MRRNGYPELLVLVRLDGMVCEARRGSLSALSQRFVFVAVSLFLPFSSRVRLEEGKKLAARLTGGQAGSWPVLLGVH